jgi:F-type H+-transporting ATPase subunit epsilon
MIHLQIVSATGIKFDDDVYEVLLPTLDGEIGVLQDHMPLVSAVTNGVISVRKQAKDADRDREYFASSGGVLEVSDNTLRVIVDEADHSENIDEKEAQAALDRAQKMKAEAKDELSLEQAQGLVDRQATRLQVANLRRRKKQG